MSALTKILTGAAGLAAVVGFASPAAAQYYPGYGNNNQGGIVGAIINGVIGGGRYGGYGYNGYGANTQVAVQQCAAAVEQRLNGGYGSYGGYGGYNQGYGGYNQGYGGYNQGYGGYDQGYGGGRVVSITHADRHSGGVIKVKGLASSGGNAGYGGNYGGYGYNNGYGGGNADLSFKCRVDYRGRIVDLDINRRTNAYYRGY